MFLLVILEVFLVIGVVLILLTQIIMPMLFGTRLFPLFRNSELKKKVEETRHQVEDLKDQNEQLDVLSGLLAERKALEEQIAKIENQSTENGVK